MTAMPMPSAQVTTPGIKPRKGNIVALRLYVLGLLVLGTLVLGILLGIMMTGPAPQGAQNGGQNAPTTHTVGAGPDAQQTAHLAAVQAHSKTPCWLEWSPTDGYDTLCAAPGQ